MTREQLTAVIDALAESADSTNDAMADDDRGRGNKAICLTIYEDGSGRIGYRGFGNEVEDVGDFDSVETVAQAMESFLGVEFE